MKSTIAALARRIIPLLFALIPFGCIVLIVNRYAIHAWNFEYLTSVPVLQLLKRHDMLGAWQRWEASFAHRSVTTFGVMLALMELTHGNMIAQLMIGPVVGLGIIFLFYRLLRRTLDDASTIERSAVAFGISLCVFSLLQWELWLRGFDDILLACFFFLCAVYAVDSPRKCWSLAALLSFLSALSYTIGLAAWPALLPLARHPTMKRWRMPALWLVILVMIVVCVTVGRNHDFYYRVSVGMRELAWVPLCALGILGAALGKGNIAASVVIGVVEIVSCDLLLATLRRSAEKDSARRWASIFCFGVLGALLIAFGRIDAGGSAVTISRYQFVGVMSLLSWVGCLLLFLRNRGWTALGAPSVLAVGALVYFLPMSVLQNFPGDHDFYEQGRACLEIYDVAADSCLQILHPDPGLVRAEAKVLEEWGYIHRFRLPPDTTVVMNGPRYGSFRFAAPSALAADDSTESIAYGWAMLPGCQRSDHVVLTVGTGRTIVGLALTIDARPDLSPCLSRSGWSVAIRNDLLKHGQAVDGWIYDPDTHRLFSLGSGRPSPKQ